MNCTRQTTTPATWRLAARYADELNLDNMPPDELRAKRRAAYGDGGAGVASVGACVCECGGAFDGEDAEGVAV